ncbi:Somatostatin receptor type 4 [Manis javanica]|nr:Somatostatin receptor type 4 [Manis javanica]
MPFYVVQLLNLFVTSLDATVNLFVTSLYALSLILGYANSCANPILYSFLSDNFRRSFQHVLCLCCCLLGAAGGAEEEPLDYYVPWLSRAEVLDADINGENYQMWRSACADGEEQK